MNILLLWLGLGVMWAGAWRVWSPRPGGTGLLNTLLVLFLAAGAVGTAILWGVR